jgi:hypothetical protein
MLRIAAAERAIDQGRFAAAVALFHECQGAQAMYLRHRQAVLESRRSRIFSLPLGVRELIHSFEGPFTVEEIWAAESAHSFYE